MNTLVAIFHLITTRFQENNQDIIEVLFVSLRSFFVSERWNHLAQLSLIKPKRVTFLEMSQSIIVSSD